MKNDYDAELHDAYDDGVVIYGHVYGDKKKRFEDGEFIRTSKVVSKGDDGIVQTLNTRYKVFYMKDNPRLDVV